MLKFTGAVWALGLAIGGAACVAPVQAADSYPDRSIRVVVPYPPGGNLDITTRAITTAMGRILKQSMVVENLGGAAGSIGSANVARTKPDGYTVLSTTIVPLVVNPTLMPNIKLGLKDFDTIGMLAVVPSVLEVNAKNGKFADFDSFIEYARQHPGGISIAHSGTGTTNDIAILQLEKSYGVTFNVIPYKGSGPALTDLLGGQVDAMVDQLTSSQPQIQAGALRALAVTSAARAPGLPEVRSVKEMGKADFDVVTYSGLLAPKGTPLEARQALNDALNKALADPTVRKQLEQVGATVVPGTIEQSSTLLANEDKKLQPLIQSGVLKPE